MFGLGFVSFYSEKESSYETQASLKFFVILLPQHLECWMIGVFHHVSVGHIYLGSSY